MSRAIIMKTLNELNDLLNKEQGIQEKPEVYGGGRKKKMVPMIGMGLQAYPVPFGGCGDMYGGKKGRKSAIPRNLTSEGRVKREIQAASNPWIQFVKDTAVANRISYAAALASPETAQAYHAGQASGAIPLPKGRGMVPVGYGMVPYGYGARIHG